MAREVYKGFWDGVDFFLQRKPYTKDNEKGEPVVIQEYYWLSQKWIRVVGKIYKEVVSFGSSNTSRTLTKEEILEKALKTADALIIAEAEIPKYRLNENISSIRPGYSAPSPRRSVRPQARGLVLLLAVDDEYIRAKIENDVEPYLLIPKPPEAEIPKQKEKPQPDLPKGHDYQI